MEWRRDKIPPSEEAGNERDSKMTRKTRMIERNVAAAEAAAAVVAATAAAVASAVVAVDVAEAR